MREFIVGYSVLAHPLHVEYSCIMVDANIDI